MFFAVDKYVNSITIKYVIDKQHERRARYDKD